MFDRERLIKSKLHDRVRRSSTGSYHTDADQAMRDARIARTAAEHPDVQTIRRWQATIGNRRTVQRIQAMRVQRDDDPGAGGGSGQATLPEPGNFQVNAGQLQNAASQDIPSNVEVQGAAPDNAAANPQEGNVVQPDGDDNAPLSVTRDPYTIQITATIPGLGLPQWRTRFGDFGLLQQPGLQLGVNLDPTRGMLVPQSYATYLAITALNWHIQRNWFDLTVSLGQLGVGPDTGTGVSGQVGGQASLGLPGHTTLNLNGAITIAPDNHGNAAVTPNPFTITWGGNF